MSYHEIQAIGKYQVACEDCGFRMTAESPGAAETFARNHIEEPDDNGETLNFSHTVRIYGFIAVGRQV